MIEVTQRYATWAQWRAVMQLKYYDEQPFVFNGEQFLGDYGKFAGYVMGCKRWH